MTHGVKKENLPSKMCVTCNRPFTWRKKWERCWDEVTTCSKGCNAKRRTLAQKEGRVLPDDFDVGDDDEIETKSTVIRKGGTPSKLEIKSEIENSKIKAVKEVSDDETIVEPRSSDTFVEPLDDNNGTDDDLIDGDDDDDETEKPVKVEKKLSRKKLQKLKMKEVESAAPVKDGPTERTKSCAVCKGDMTLLFRCQWDVSKQWRFVCKPCWPSVSGAASSKAAMKDPDGNFKSGNPLYHYGGTWKGRGRDP